MGKLRLVAILWFLALVAARPAFADALKPAGPIPLELRDDSDDCHRAADVNRRIRGCTALIDYERENLIAPSYATAFTYADRGLAYTEKEEFDRAIADFGEAIRIAQVIHTTTICAETPTMVRATRPKHWPTSEPPLDLPR